MIRSLKLFADCVESLRTAEKKYEEEPTAFNLNIQKGMQNKVDGWIKWVREQQDVELTQNVPPFINRRPSTGSYKGVMSNDLMNQLMANHTPEEIERYTRLMQGKI
jgi:hypothetical protein